MTGASDDEHALDPVYDAIGRIVVADAQQEHLLTRIHVQLLLALNRRDEDDKIGKGFTPTVKAIRHLLLDNSTLASERRDDLTRLLAEVTASRDARHQAVHGVWAVRYTTEGSVPVSMRMRGAAQHDVTDRSPTRLRALAAQIRAHNERLRSHLP